MRPKPPLKDELLLTSGRSSNPSPFLYRDFHAGSRAFRLADRSSLARDKSISTVTDEIAGSFSPRARGIFYSTPPNSPRNFTSVDYYSDRDSRGFRRVESVKTRVGETTWINNIALTITARRAGIFSPLFFFLSFFLFHLLYFFFFCLPKISKGDLFIYLSRRRSFARFYKPADLIFILSLAC